MNPLNIRPGTVKAVDIDSDGVIVTLGKPPHAPGRRACVYYPPGMTVVEVPEYPATALGSSEVATAVLDAYQDGAEVWISPSQKRRGWEIGPAIFVHERPGLADIGSVRDVPAEEPRPKFDLAVSGEFVLVVVGLVVLILLVLFGRI